MKFVISLLCPVVCECVNDMIGLSTSYLLNQEQSSATTLVFTSFSLVQDLAEPIVGFLRSDETALTLIAL